jgi:hypothetical protein
MTDAQLLLPKESPVEIHKPHAAKTWKEFFIELGTITLGVLIALAAEQTAETLHNRGRAAIDMSFGG